MSRIVTVVRCPRCGSTNAAENGGSYEFTEMRCASCSHRALCDDEQIKDNWNVTIELPDDATALPAVIPID